MMTRWMRNLLLGAVSLSSAFAAAPIRQWTTAAGRTFEASLVKADSEEAIFMYEGGRSFAMPLSDLHPTDRSRVLNRNGVTSSVSAPLKSTNFGYSWPRGVRTDGDVISNVISEDKSSGRYVYESAHYRFHSDARLTQDVLRNFAMMFETTHKFASSLPLSLQESKLYKGKLTILLFETEQAYYAAGGPAGTAGCYASTGIVLVPMSSLGLTRSGTGFSLDMSKKNSVLIHELAHQMTPGIYFQHGALGWFTEGLAEYFAATPYTWGYFQPDPYGNSVLSYVTAFGDDKRMGRNLGKKIQVPRLREFFLMSYPQFAGGNANVNYGFGLLLTHYFFHIADGGNAQRIGAFLKGVSEGKSGESVLAPLLAGGTYEKLETEIAAEWRKKGVEITFGF